MRGEVAALVSWASGAVAGDPQQPASTRGVLRRFDRRRGAHPEMAVGPEARPQRVAAELPLALTRTRDYVGAVGERREARATLPRVMRTSLPAAQR